MSNIEIQVLMGYILTVLAIVLFFISNLLKNKCAEQKNNQIKYKSVFRIQQRVEFIFLIVFIVAICIDNYLLLSYLILYVPTNMTWLYFFNFLVFPFIIVVCVYLFVIKIDKFDRNILGIRTYRHYFGFTKLNKLGYYYIPIGVLLTIFLFVFYTIIVFLVYG